MHVDSRLAQLCLKGQCFMSYLNPRSDTSYFHIQYKTKGTRYLRLYGILKTYSIGSTVTFSHFGL
jgi:hypothetical protein